MGDEACPECRWSSVKVTDTDEYGEPIDGDPVMVLECRRYPPVVVWASDTDDPLQVWPQMDLDHWCGEWRR